MKVSALIPVVCGLLCAGCARTAVELYRGPLPNGEVYALVHRASHVPFADGGTLFLIVNLGKQEEVKVRLTRGYDVYTDLQLRIAMSDDVLFVSDERLKQTWAIDLRRKSLIDHEPTGLAFVDVGESFRR